MSVPVDWVVQGLAPSYLDLGVEEIRRRATEALSLLGPDRCLVCPRLCRVDRLGDRKGLCAIGRRAVVASHIPHFGEENCLRGRNGSGTIFFSGCNLRWVFCQNHDISWEVRGERVTPLRLAAMMVELQGWGCHNINFVTPEHVVPQILEALPHAVEAGLRLPIVYNTSSYDRLDSLRSSAFSSSGCSGPRRRRRTHRTRLPPPPASRPHLDPLHLLPPPRTRRMRHASPAPPSSMAPACTGLCSGAFPRTPGASW